jgi:hypothetical protein
MKIAQSRHANMFGAVLRMPGDSSAHERDRRDSTRGAVDAEMVAPGVKV